MGDKLMKKKSYLSNRRLPHFIIAGSMKCGTSSLHMILANHPKIFIPNAEIGFYDIDNHIQHPDFFFYSGAEWYYPRFEEKMNEYLDWYESFFKDAEEDVLLGERSTTYIASERAAERIARLNPKAKIIIMLRDPASRTYSHYWHLVRTGRAIWNFENSLQVMPENLIQRSLYKKQIEHFMKIIPQENFHFILFEEFVQNMRNVLEGVFQFLGISYKNFNLSEMKTHYNVTTTPKSLTLQLWRNQLLRLRARRVYLDHLIDVPNRTEITDNMILRIIDLLHRIINPHKEKKPPNMKMETRMFLNYYFSRENGSLSGLIGKDVESFWYLD